MQSLQHQQQQLAALVSAAQDKSSNTTQQPTQSQSQSQSESDNNINNQQDHHVDFYSNRIGAITSLHRAILFPPNSLLVHHSASFLFQAFSKLLSDKYTLLSSPLLF